MANPVQFYGNEYKRIDDAIVANDARFTPTKAYISNTKGIEVKDNISDVSDAIEVDLSVTRIANGQYVLVCQKTLDTSTNWNRIYITNTNGETIICGDYDNVVGATDIYETMIWKLDNDCSELVK